MASRYCPNCQEVVDARVLPDYRQIQYRGIKLTNRYQMAFLIPSIAMKLLIMLLFLVFGRGIKTSRPYSAIYENNFDSADRENEDAFSQSIVDRGWVR